MLGNPKGHHRERQMIRVSPSWLVEMVAKKVKSACACFPADRSNRTSGLGALSGRITAANRFTAAWARL